MPARTRSPRILLVLAVLTATLGAVSGGAALARGLDAPAAPVVDAAPGGAVAPVVSTEARATVARSVPPVGDYDRGPSLRNGLLVPRPAATTTTRWIGAGATTPIGTAWISRATTDTPAPKARSESTSDPVGGGSAAGLSGRNKVWIPALGIRRSISFYSCSSNAYPGDRVYRWGCAGRNNIYLFGHAHSVFKPLHDAYVRGRLQKGMKVHVADGEGRVSTYAVRWWRVTTPDKGAFAYAGQSRPSMTLQTCVGAKSQYRLIVRLVKVG